MTKKDKHEIRAHATNDDLKEPNVPPAPSLAEQTRLCGDANYYKTGLLIHLQSMSKIRPPSEVFDVLNICAECKHHKIGWKTTHVVCELHPLNKPGQPYCNMEKRRIWDEVVMGR